MLDIRGDVPGWMAVHAGGQDFIFDESMDFSQYGDAAQGFREAPRFPKERAVSMVSGRLTAEETYRCMMSRLPKAGVGPRVRWFEWTSLARHRYVVHSTPSPRNPSHVSVSWLPQQARDGFLHESVDVLRSAWDDPNRVRLSEFAEEGK